MEHQEIKTLLLKYEGYLITSEQSERLLQGKLNQFAIQSKASLTMIIPIFKEIIEDLKSLQP